MGSKAHYVQREMAEIIADFETEQNISPEDVAITLYRLEFGVPHDVRSAFIFEPWEVQQKFRARANEVMTLFGIIRMKQ
jgi:hypothetical protein